MKDVFISGQISVSTVQMMLRLCDVVFFLSLGVVCVCDSVLKAVSGQRFKIFIFPSLNKTGRHQNLQAMFFNSFLIRFINFVFFLSYTGFPPALTPPLQLSHVSTIALSSIFLSLSGCWVLQESTGYRCDKTGFPGCALPHKFVFLLASV